MIPAGPARSPEVAEGQKATLSLSMRRPLSQVAKSPTMTATPRKLHQQTNHTNRSSRGRWRSRIKVFGFQYQRLRRKIPSQTQPVKSAHLLSALALATAENNLCLGLTTARVWCMLGIVNRRELTQTLQRKGLL